MSETSGLNHKISSLKKGIRSFFIQSHLVYRSIFFGKKQKIFILSFQRSGTKSASLFFREHNYFVCGWGYSKKRDWNLKWLQSDYDAIFNSLEFKAGQVYEDSPWFFQGFYKILFWKFPNSKFVFIERNSDKWFNSMMSHSNLRTLGNTHVHAVIYDRMNEVITNPEVGYFENSIEKGLPLTEEHREHYKAIYNKAIDDMKLFFNHHDPGGRRFFYGKLEDENVWLQLGAFIGVKSLKAKVFHAHKTADVKKRKELQLNKFIKK